MPPEPQHGSYTRPLSARAPRPAPAPRRPACRTRRRACPRPWRTSPGSTRRPRRAGRGPRLAPCAGEAGAVEQVEQLTEAALVDAVPVEDPRQSRSQPLVGPHEQIHRVVNQLADRLGPLPHSRLQTLGVCRQVGPACGRRHPEHAVTGVLVDVVDELGDLVLVGPVASSSARICACRSSKASETYFRNTKAEDDVLVLRGVHRPPQLVRGLPQRVLELFHRRRQRVDLLLRRHVSALPLVAGW